MFRINKKSGEFIFLESEDKVLVFKNKSGEVSKVAELSLAGLVSSLEKLKKDNSEIIKAKNVWMLDARLENIEKAPLNKDEMLNFVKWKVQEVIDVPLHDVYFDLLTNNQIDDAFYKKYTTTIIAKKQHIDSISQAFSAVKIPLLAIDSKPTVLLDFFTKNKEILDKKSLTFLTLSEDRAVIYVYYEQGIVFERAVEFPRLKSYVGRWQELPEEEYQQTLDKLCLEIQRNVDFIDRQYGIQHFENIIYSMPENELFKKFSEYISNYFSVAPLDINKYLTLRVKEDEIIPLNVLCAFEYGNYVTENINLLPKIEKKTGFLEDLKKVVMASLLFGVVMAIFGSYYEWKAKEFIDIEKAMSSECDILSKELATLKAKPSNTNEVLEKEVENLLRNKQEVLRLQSQKTTVANIYQKIMKDIAVQAKDSNVLLTSIKFSDNSVSLIGQVSSKDIFTDFLKNLQKAENLKGISLGIVSIEEAKEGVGFMFLISSSVEIKEMK